MDDSSPASVASSAVTNVSALVNTGVNSSWFTLAISVALLVIVFGFWYHILTGLKGDLTS
jgi:hypothetical protein